MLRLVIAPLYTCFLLPAAAQLLSQHRTLGGDNDEYVGQVIATTDGGYLIAGSTGSFGPSASDLAMNAYLIKLDAEGDTLWTRVFGGSGSDGLQSLAATDNGGCVVAGAYDANAQDILLARFSDSGTPIWVKRIGSVTHHESARKVISLDNDEYLVVGSRWQVAGGADGNMLAVKVNGAGSVIWSSECGSALQTEAYDAVRTADGGYLITGVRWQLPNTHLQLVRLAADGTYQWDKTYQSTGSASGVAIITHLPGNYLVAGSNSNALAVWKVDPEGEIIWEHDYACDGSFAARSIGRHEGSDVLVTGSSSDALGTTAHHALLLNPMGSMIRQSVYGGSIGNSDAASVTEIAAGGLVITGTIVPNAGTQGSEIDIVHTLHLMSPCDDNTSLAVEVAPPGFTSTQVMSALPAPSLQVIDLSMQMTHGGSIMEICTNVGIEEGDRRVYELEASPNPASGTVWLQVRLESATHLEATNAIGEIVLSTSARGNIELDISSWRPGLYFLRAIDRDGGSRSTTVLVL